jgi:hypothetical protein
MYISFKSMIDFQFPIVPTEDNALREILKNEISRETKKMLGSLSEEGR